MLLAVSLELHAAKADYTFRNSSGDSLDQDLQLIVCKEIATHQLGLKRRQNSGITHGYLIDYNRLELWANPRINADLRGIVTAKFRAVGKRDSVGFDLINTLIIDSVWNKDGRLNFNRQGDAFYVVKPGGWVDQEADSLWP